ncbi:MAG TPA: hypothetical protein VFG33_00060 [Kribbella sp.]|uniref:hypothetical protein n=1 Tax=Kribbella sp. TaxID=1871183 RepID=UPI002D773C13|nr:hypothetical protein [Kribbella sp.]HET6291723.1 hypothetical protein [Kribbella sp.]
MTRPEVDAFEQKITQALEGSRRRREVTSRYTAVVVWLLVGFAGLVLLSIVQAVEAIQP